MWDSASLKSMHEAAQRTSIARGAKILHATLTNALNTGEGVSFCRGTMFLRNHEDKQAVRELLAFLHRHSSPFDTGFSIKKEGGADA